MKKFKFRLQTVLDINQNKLEEQQLLLAKIISLLDVQNSVLNEMKQKEDQINQCLGELLLSSNIETDKICNYSAFAQRIGFDIKTQIDIISKTQLDLENQQQEVAKAYKEVKILEKLKEKQQKQHFLEFEKAQIKEIDDITISRYKQAS